MFHNVKQVKYVKFVLNIDCNKPKLVYTTRFCIFSDINRFILKSSDISLYFDNPHMEPDLKQI